MVRFERWKLCLLAVLAGASAARAVHSQSSPQLYSQRGHEIADGVPFLDRHGAELDSWAADDVVTPPGQLWFVSALRVDARLDAAGGSAPDSPDPIDVSFHLDAAGRPGTEVCRYPGVVPVVEPRPSSPASLLLQLPDACMLCAGSHYWIVLQQKGSGGDSFRWRQRAAAAFQPALWKAPGGGYGGACLDWGAAGAACGWGGAAAAELSFALYGASSAPPYTKGDFNGDLCFDLVLQRQGPGPTPAAVLIWPLDGIRRTGEEISLTPSPGRHLWIAGADDFNGDRRSDLVLRDETTGAVEVWMMNGAARIGAAVPLDTGGRTLSVTQQLEATGDFDGDGRPDLLFRDLGTLRTEIWTLDGARVTGTLSTHPDTTGYGNWRVAGAADVDRDGNLDLLWNNDSSFKAVVWALDGNRQQVQATSGPTEPNHPDAPDNHGTQVAAAGCNGPPDAAATTPTAPGAVDLIWQLFDLDADALDYPRTSHDRLIIWQTGGGPGGRTRTDQMEIPLPELLIATPDENWRVVAPR